MQEITDYINSTPLYVRTLILAGLAMLLAIVIRIVIFGILRATNRRVDSFTIDTIVKRMSGPVFWFVATAMISIFWGGLHREFPDHVGLWVATRVANTLLYVFAALVLIRLTDVISDTIRHRFNVDNKNNLSERKILTQLQYIRKIVIIAIVIVSVAFILLQFDTVKNLGTGLLTASGVTGIIIGLAAQKSIANLLAGFQIAFTQPIRLDDALLINGEFGRVEEITLTYVTLKLWDERRMVVPLQYFIDNPFQNWTRSSSQLVGTVLLYTDFSVPLEELRAELDRFLPTQELWDERVKNLQVTDLSDRVMTVRVLVSSIDSGSTFTLRCIVREHLITFIQQNYPESLPRTRVDLPVEGNGGLEEN
ncbi:mechanosensitive ion channel protein MscS [Lewinellaceae bacterium SD302]|nr:mechanosensitive ion channel protein MscS [Lewinellaceae bacterium SD302]